MPPLTLKDFHSPSSRAKRGIGHLEKALNNLIAEYGNDAYDAMTVAIGKNKYKAFLAGGLTESKGRAAVLRLNNVQEMEGYETSLPFFDHCQLFNWRTKPLFFVFHPYSQPDHNQLDEFCKKHGLEWALSAHFWHFPTRTLMVMIWNPLTREKYRAALRQEQRASQAKE